MKADYVFNWQDHLSFNENDAMPQNIIEDSNVRVVLCPANRTGKPFGSGWGEGLRPGLMK